MLEILSQAIAALALWGLFWLTGLGPAGRLDARVAGRWPILAPLVLGIGTWTALLFLLAGLQLLRPLPILLAAMALCGWGVAVLLRRRHHLDRARQRAAPAAVPTIDRVATWILVATVTVVAADLLLEALHPGASWDAQAYHLTVPKLYLAHGGFFRVPYNVYSNWPLGVELLFALAMVVRDYVLAKTVHFGFAVVTLAAVYCLAARRTSAWTGSLAASLVLLNPVVLFEARIAYVDLAVAFFFVAAFSFLAHGLDTDLAPTHRRTALALSGLCCALAAGAKLSGFFVVLSLLPVLLAARRRDLKRALLEEVPLLLGPAALGLLPWLLKSAILTGNPVYPLLYSVFGGPEWSAELGRQHAAWQSSIGMGRGLLDYLLLPVRVILFGGLGYDHFDGRLHPAWLVFLPLGIAAARTSSLARQALGAAATYFLLWAITSQQARFLIPILPLLAVPSALAVWQLTRRVAPLWGSLARLAVGGFVAVLLVLAAWPWLERSPRMAATLAEHGAELRRAVVPPAIHFVNETLPRDTRLLLLNTNQGFYLDRDYVADSFFEASQIAAYLTPAPDPAAARDRLRELGVTHLFLDRRSRGIAYPTSLERLLQDPLLVTPIYSSPDGRFVVLSLH